MIDIPRIFVPLYQVTMLTRLTIELVPSGQWEKNLRSILPPEEWDLLRKDCYQKAGYRCEICGGRGPKHPCEAHEVWFYDEESKTQRLDGLMALCPKCHAVKHMGYSMSMGKGEQATQHLMEINGWTASDAQYYIEAIFELWHRRSREDWTLDLGWLKTKKL